MPAARLRVGRVEPPQEPRLRGRELGLQLAQRGQHPAEGGRVQQRRVRPGQVVQPRVHDAQRVGDAAGQLIAHAGPPP